jgi:aspartyl/asparaginyl-tRNA synthetase
VGQRIHDYAQLVESLTRRGMNLSNVEGYLEKPFAATACLRTAGMGMVTGGALTKQLLGLDYVRLAMPLPAPIVAGAAVRRGVWRAGFA